MWHPWGLHADTQVDCGHLGGRGLAPLPRQSRPLLLLQEASPDHPRPQRLALGGNPATVIVWGIRAEDRSGPKAKAQARPPWANGGRWHALVLTGGSGGGPAQAGEHRGCLKSTQQRRVSTGLACFLAATLPSPPFLKGLIDGTGVDRAQGTWSWATPAASHFNPHPQRPGEWPGASQKSLVALGDIAAPAVDPTVGSKPKEVRVAPRG